MRKKRLIKLDRKIRIENPTDSVSTSGGFSTTWATLAEVRANVKYTGSIQERQESDRETAFTNVVFTIRYNANYKDKSNRILFEGQYFDILSISEKTRRHYLEIKAQLRE